MFNTAVHEPADSVDAPSVDSGGPSSSGGSLGPSVSKGLATTQFLHRSFFLENIIDWPAHFCADLRQRLMLLRQKKSCLCVRCGR